MKKLLVLFISLFLCGSVFAQSADVITEILNAEEVTYGQICYLCATYEKLVSDDATFEDAANALLENNMLPGSVDLTQAIPVGNLAFLFAKIWKVEGGLFYRLTNGSPRYAYKQLKTDGIIGEKLFSNSTISGMEALNMYTACSFEYGKAELGI